jgi:thiosulfate/3-mercaptopyruvate sulfurtransferase
MPDDYARPEMLAETDWLAEHIDDPDVIVVDCDEMPGYVRHHIEGAIGLRVHHYFKGKDGVHLMPPDQFEQTMSRHGIGNDKTVVAYDGMGGVYAARLWWALDYYGHSNVKLLNGGFRKWFSEGRLDPSSRRTRPVSFQTTRPKPADFKVQPGPDSLCSTDDVRNAIDDENTVIWDVRSQPEYDGTDDRPNKRHGHIPGAAHLEWLDMTAPPKPSGLLLPADEIRAKLETLGITPEKTVLTH